MNVDHQVVGRIWVSDTTSDVMLVTDPASSIDGVIERSVHAVCSWHGQIRFSGGGL